MSDIVAGHSRSDVAMTVRQFKAQNRSFWRNPAAAFFTFLFPLMFMVIFNLLFNDPYTGRGPRVSASTFFTPAIIALSLVGACFTNIAIGLTFNREQGILKRVRGTPLPDGVYLAGFIANAVFIALILVVIVGAFGAIVYNVDLPTRTLPAFLLTVLVGSFCFTALGVAVTTLVPNADAAPPMINGMILPLLFISDVFVPLENAPAWLTTFSNIFPIKHLSNSLLTAFIPTPGRGSGIVVDDLLVMAAWGIAGVLIAARTFRWDPKR